MLMLTCHVQQQSTKQTMDDKVLLNVTIGII